MKIQYNTKLSRTVQYQTTTTSINYKKPLNTTVVTIDTKNLTTTSDNYSKTNKKNLQYKLKKYTNYNGTIEGNQSYKDETIYEKSLDTINKKIQLNELPQNTYKNTRKIYNSKILDETQKDRYIIKNKVEYDKIKTKATDDIRVYATTNKNSIQKINDTIKNKPLKNSIIIDETSIKKKKSETDSTESQQYGNGPNSDRLHNGSADSQVKNKVQIQNKDIKKVNESIRSSENENNLQNDRMDTDKVQVQNKDVKVEVSIEETENINTSGKNINKISNYTITDMNNIQSNSILVSLLRDKMKQIRKQTSESTSTANVDTTTTATTTVTTTNTTTTTTKDSNTPIENNKDTGIKKNITTQINHQKPINTIIDLLRDSNNAFGLKDKNYDTKNIVDNITMSTNYDNDTNKHIEKQKEQIIKRSKNRIMVTIQDTQSIRTLSKQSNIPHKKLLKDCITIQNKDTKMININTILNNTQAEMLMIMNNVETLSYDTTSPDDIVKLIECGVINDNDNINEIKKYQRSPVVCLMGHVDHGKTTLLDTLRNTNIAKNEAGKITQSIGSFTVPVYGEIIDLVPCITFVDTPGHAIFTSMRQRGACIELTDIIIVVISSVDHIQIQTKEVIELAHSKKRPIIIAITKCDLIESEPYTTLNNLKDECNIICDKIGGTIPSIFISSITKQGINELIETIALQASTMNLYYTPRQKSNNIKLKLWMNIQNSMLKNADILNQSYIELEQYLVPSIINKYPPISIIDINNNYKDIYNYWLKRIDEILRHDTSSLLATFSIGYAYAVEICIQRGIGIIAHAILRQGEIHIGEYIVYGKQYCTVRSLIDSNGKTISSATARTSTPIQIIGLKNIISINDGNDIIVVPNETVAKHFVQLRIHRSQSEKRQICKDLLSGTVTTSNSNSSNSNNNNNINITNKDVINDKITLKVIVKADVQGSIQVLLDYIQNLHLSKYSNLVHLDIIYYNIGDITIHDINYAKARGINTIIIGFNIKATNKIVQLAKEFNISMYISNIIFNVFDYIRDTLSKLLPTKENYIIIGTARISMIFKIRMSKSTLNTLQTNIQDTIGKTIDIDTTCYVAGSKVIDGTIYQSPKYLWRIVRNDVIIESNLYAIQLRMYKEILQNIDKGKECGILLNKSTNIQVGDILQCYQIQYFHPTYDDTVARGYTPVLDYNSNDTKQFKYNESYELVSSSKSRSLTK